MIHPTAIIHPSAQLGKDVSIGAYSIIGAEVSIGDSSWVGPHVVISGPTSIGTHNKIYQFCSLGEAPQDLKYGGEPTKLTVGDHNVIREYVTFNRGTIDGTGETRIGSNNLFMAYCHVAHDCRIGDYTVFANAASLAGHVEVGDYSTLGGFTSVHQFSRLGSRCFTGLGSVITQDIPPFSTAAGNRARAIAINKVGLSRKGFSSELIAALHKSFRLLIMSKKPRQAALEELQPFIALYPEVKMFVEFVENSERGIAR
jgi:UDP-N-acetylglucosamine acyltransferase